MKQEVRHRWILAAAAMMFWTLPEAVDAKMVSTTQATGQMAADQERARVQAFLDRKDARAKLQAMGIDAQAVKERLAGLTGVELHELAQKLDTLPAGGDISNRELIAILLIVLLVVLLI